MTATIRHMTTDGRVFTRRTEHDYRYVVVQRYRPVDGDRATFAVISWHKTESAARRNAVHGRFVEAVNDGTRAPA